MSFLLPNQELVTVERQELFDKMILLRVFLQRTSFLTIDPYEQDRLKEQYGYMSSYLDVLDRRIAAF